MSKETNPVVEEWLKALTLEEKAALLAGHNFMYTNAVPRLGIPAIRMSDGPHGLRVQNSDEANSIMGTSVATSFPTASCSANSWNPLLMEKMGNAIAEEAKFYGVNILLGPGVNIKRNPLCGRNFEYFSEDPILAGEMGVGEVKGLQEKGVGVSVKHFAFNNTENFRMLGDSVIDPRAIREIYLKQFERIVKKANPDTLMCAYNKLNGVHCSENEWLLNEVLRKDWGYEGLVMSDWGTTHDRLLGIRSGLDLEMPGDNDICRKWIVDAANDGSLSQEDLDEAVRNVLNLVMKHKDDVRLSKVDWDAHNDIAGEIASEGAVLLKNEGLLPLNKDEHLLIIGELFEKMRYQGSGSSMITPARHKTPKQAFDENEIDYAYFPGYRVRTVEVDQKLIDEALDAAKDVEKAVLFLGLTDEVEGEGWDREHMRLPENQLALVDALIKAGKKIALVLYGGSVIELPFFEHIDSALHMFLPGQNGGQATYDLLFGIKNPSGRLAETWPLSYEDVLYGDVFSKTSQEIYKESIYVGYRYYISKGKEVRFPFGHGLSYTEFECSNFNVKEEGENLLVTVDVKNVGKRLGKEVVEIYVSAPRTTIHKPLRELKGFTKLELQTGESKKAEIRIAKEDLRCFDLDENRFILEEGEYAIQVGKNARDILLEKKITLRGETPKTPKHPQKAYEELEITDISDESFEEMWGMKIPAIPPKKPITLESQFLDLKGTFFGRILYNAVIGVARKDLKKAKKMPEGPERDNRIKASISLERMMMNNTLIGLSMASSGQFSYNLACGFRELSNGHLIKGIKQFTHKVKAPALPAEEEE